MRLLVDLNVSPRVASLLRSMGHEVERVGDVLDARATDIAILERAARAGAVVVSQDQDFSALIAARGQIAPSLVNVRLSTVDSDSVARIVHAVVVHAAEDLSAGAIVTIDDGRVRLRRLPVRAV